MWLTTGTVQWRQVAGVGGRAVSLSSQSGPPRPNMVTSGYEKPIRPKCEIRGLQNSSSQANRWRHGRLPLGCCTDASKTLNLNYNSGSKSPYDLLRSDVTGDSTHAVLFPSDHWRYSSFIHSDRGWGDFKAKVNWLQIRSHRNHYSLYTSSQWPFSQKLPAFLDFKSPLMSSPCISRAVCLPPGYDALWCHWIAVKNKAWEMNIPAAGMWGTSTVSCSRPCGVIRQP